MKSGFDPLDPRWSVRRQKVERARQLLRDPNYPPKEVIDAVAKILAQKLKPLPPAEEDPS